MRSITLVNLVGYIAALVLAAAGVLLFSRHGNPAATEATAATATVIRDSRGAEVRIRPWRRIATLDLVADEMAALLVEPGRIAAVSEWAQGSEAWRFAGTPRLQGLNSIEAVVAMRPDLVLLSTYGGETDKIQRLREAGITVFDLGPAGGLREYTANLRRIGILAGAAERGERIAAQLERRMAAVAVRIPQGAVRRRALVLTPVPAAVYGGTVGSSFHDILVAAGCDDVAAGRFAEPWPSIGAEQALDLDPDLIVTRTGAAADLRSRPGFGHLRALSDPGGVIELPVELFDSPGLNMLDAAERLCELAYPEKR